MHHCVNLYTNQSLFPLNDKFIGSLGIIRDYYHNLDNRPLIELPFSTIDIIKDEMVIIYKKGFNNTD